jgi:hypothetical protein
MTNNIFTGDPTRTITLRKRFVQEFTTRFNAVKFRSNISIDKNDCFGLKPLTFQELQGEKAGPEWKLDIPPIPVREYALETDSEKSKQYMKWLDSTVDTTVYQPLTSQNVLNEVNDSERIWTYYYTILAYLHGLSWANSNVRKNKKIVSKLGLSSTVLSNDNLAIKRILTSQAHAEEQMD